MTHREGLKRAAQKARKTARDTRTPLVIYKNGRIIMQPVEEETVFVKQVVA